MDTESQKPISSRLFIRSGAPSWGQKGDKYAERPEPIQNNKATEKRELAQFNQGFGYGVWDHVFALFFQRSIFDASISVFEASVLFSEASVLEKHVLKSVCFYLERLFLVSDFERGAFGLSGSP